VNLVGIVTQTTAAHNASAIAYDNSSGLTSTNVQGAIEELESVLDETIGDNIQASKIKYDDTNTSLGATSVQDAIEIIDSEADRISGEVTSHIK